MRTEKLLFPFLLSICLLAMGFQCGQDQGPLVFEHSYDLPIRVYPNRPAYKVGDTIWLETVSSGKLLFDRISNQFLVADSGEVKLWFTFFNFAGNSSSARKIVSFTSPSGLPWQEQLFNGSQSVHFEMFGCHRPDYKEKVGVVLENAGIFWIELPEFNILGSCLGGNQMQNSKLNLRFANDSLNQPVFDQLTPQEQRSGNSRDRFISSFTERRIFVLRVV